MTMLVWIATILSSIAEGSLSPIRVGAWTNLFYVDEVSKAGIIPVYDGLRAAFKAVNAAGGVHGRNLSLMECEAYLTPSKYASCLDSFVSNGALATIGIYIDRDFTNLVPLLQQQNIMLVAPITSQPRSFDHHWIYTRSDQIATVEAMMRHVANVLRVRRVGFTYPSDLNACSAIIDTITRLCNSLGLTFVGSFSVNQTSPGYHWRTDKYYDFLATRPQVILSFGVSIQSNEEFLLEIFNRSMFGNGVDPNLKFVTWDGYVASVARVFGKLQKVNGNFTVEGRVFFSLGLPTMTDESRPAAVHARRDMYDYWNGTYSFLNNRTDYMVNSLSFWISARVIVEVIKRMNPLNLTKDAFIDTVFSMGTYLVDDLVFGIYSGSNCSVPGLCPCNQGHHTVYTYYMNNSFALVPVPQGETSTPIGDCGSTDPFVTPPLIYLPCHASDNPLVNTAVTSMLQVVAANGSIYVDSFAATNATVVVPQLAQATNDAYFSVVFPAVFTEPVDLSEIESAFIVDPLYFPARLTPAFRANVVYLSATLEQEVYAWFSALASPTWPGANVSGSRNVFSVVRSSEAAAVLNVIVKSATTFDITLLGNSLTDGANAALLLPATPFTGTVIVIGQRSAADVAAVASFLAANVNARVFVAYSELSVLYDSGFTTIAHDAASRVLFASSQPSWLSNASDLMQSFRSAIPPAVRSPLSLRGFVVSVALDFVSQLVLPKNLTSFNIKQSWYDTSVIGLDTNTKAGPYSRTPCVARTASELCEMNIGVRSVNVFALGTAGQAGSSSAALATAYFTSGRVEYTSGKESGESSLTTAQLVGIIVGVAVGSVLIFAFFAILLRSGRRKNSCAPTDPTKPVTVVFTDIQASTAMWAVIPQIMVDALSRHHDIIRSIIGRHKCYEVKTIGDAFMIVTRDPSAALALARDIQIAFFEEPWAAAIDEVYKEIEREENEPVGSPSPTADLPRAQYESSWNGLRVRIGIHTGIADIRLDEITHGYDYYGQVTNVAARTESHAQGGQILVSSSTMTALSGSAILEEMKVSSIGIVALRGVTDPIELFQADAVVGRTFVVNRGEGDGMDSDAAAGRSSDHVEGLLSDRKSDSDSIISDEKEVDDPHRNQHLHRSRCPPDWVTMTCGFVSTLLSTSARDAQGRALRALCDRWRVDLSNLPVVSAVKTSSSTSSVMSLDADPVVQALARRIAPVMRRKFGPLVSSGNYIPPTTSGDFHNPKLCISGELLKSTSHAMSPRGGHNHHQLLDSAKPGLNRSVEYLSFASTE